jgi:hypothetical protein
MGNCDLCGKPLIDGGGVVIMFGNWENSGTEDQEFDSSGNEYDACDDCAGRVAEFLDSIRLERSNAENR